MTPLKFIHLSAVVLSATGFLVRGIWSFYDRDWRSRRWVRIIPHTVDSVLLLSGLAMVLVYHWAPLRQPWLMTKLLLLLAYILLGMVALRWGASLRVRFGAWVLALAVFGYIIAVALTKNPFAGLS